MQYHHCESTLCVTTLCAIWVYPSNPWHLYTVTNIDWRAYMEQVETFLRGERNYTKIKGDTGPLV